jgi:Protein of unknown function (DUF3710)
MAFGRSKKAVAASASADTVDDAGEPDADAAGEPADIDVVVARAPIDEADAGSDEVLPRIDLGGLRVPVLPGTEVRVELNEAQFPIAATIVHGGSSLQVLAFAAPRNSGIWAEVRAEIAESVRAEGGHVDEVEAGFGPELHTRVRGAAQQGKATEQVLRFVGFDGPRWFVRGVFSGPAATHPAQATVLETVLTSIVVVRGTDPMAPRDPLPLRLPKEAVAAADPAAAAAAAAEDARPVFELPQRGREITETS